MSCQVKERQSIYHNFTSLQFPAFKDNESTEVMQESKEIKRPQVLPLKKAH